MTRYEYRTVDVFTDKAFGGNPLAVFREPGKLDATTMQAIAKELHLSETTFVLPPSSSAADHRVRIFTPDSELPFAGHPVLGTAFVLASERGAREVSLRTGAGQVPVVFDERGRGTMSQPLPEVSTWIGDASALHSALGITGSALPLDGYVNGPNHVY